MKIKDQIEAMARADGWLVVAPRSIFKGYIIRADLKEPYDYDALQEEGKLHYFDKVITDPDDPDEFPAYTTSHDVCQRVIDELKSELNYGEVFELYQKSLKKIICPNGLGFGWLGRVLRATPLQKCEAILKAKGLWTKEME